ncbi:MAG TPA: uracil-DNA glycosylase [Rhizomicrobium sp.]|nr:uracil-DNA glycosylase [Rhizomicrobium sp.]
MQPIQSSNPLADLAWLVDAGADEALLDEPVNRFSQKAASAAVPKTTPSTSRPIPVAAPPHAGERRSFPHENKAAPPGAYTDQIGAALEVASRCSTLSELRAALEAFDGGALKKNSTNTVFADGNPDARIMLIGEAPGRDEDRAGLPFVGRAGKLLDKMVAPIGLNRAENFYITNVLPWQPPGNRDFGLEEAAMCLPFLRRHIELKSPDILLLLGRIAVKNVLGKTEGIMSLRGKWFEYYVNGRMIPVLCTLHPAYLLRRPVDKKLAWRDMQAFEAKAKELGILA